MASDHSGLIGQIIDSLLEETDHICGRGQEKVAKIVHCGGALLLNTINKRPPARLEAANRKLLIVWSVERWYKAREPSTSSLPSRSDTFAKLGRKSCLILQLPSGG